MSSGLDSNQIGEWLGDAKSALGFLKAILPLIPKGGDRAKAEEQVGQAEAALAKSEATLAKELGFPLCQCTFPPQIMLWKEGEKAHVCPRPECGHTRAKGMRINSNAVVLSRGPNSWMGR